MLLSFLKRFGITETAWLIEWSFDQLHGWHEWAMNFRQISPSGLIAPGSDPILPLVDPSDWGVNTMQGARWETGMDNSPMRQLPLVRVEVPQQLLMGMTLTANCDL